MTNNGLLEELYTEVLKINPKSNLMPIPGGGKTTRPKFMFVFINPTIRNISSSASWQGIRAPFIGTKHIWRIFAKAGLFSEELLNQIESTKNWTTEFAEIVYNHISDSEFYITNIVKWCGDNADLPNKDKIKLFTPLLVKEIEIVKPLYIVAFGLIPFENLTKKKLKLGEYHLASMSNKKLEVFETTFGKVKTKVIPCYFPVGRGSPKKAVELLKLLKTL